MNSKDLWSWVSWIYRSKIKKKWWNILTFLLYIYLLIMALIAWETSKVSFHIRFPDLNTFFFQKTHSLLCYDIWMFFFKWTLNSKSGNNIKFSLIGNRFSFSLIQYYIWCDKNFMQAAAQYHKCHFEILHPYLNLKFLL